MLKISKQFLPPQPVVSALVWLAQYYPKLVMPATDFESTFDDAFGDKEWARTARADPKVTRQIKPTIGAVAATLGTGQKLLSKAQSFPVPLYALHGKGDTRTSCEAIQEFVDRIGPNRATMEYVDTSGHQLLQDTPEIVRSIQMKVKNWIVQISSGNR
jgi:alpha-beta hydrolase superfamily lysophospholipase